MRFESEIQIERWLQDQPALWSHILASRSMLRALPYVSEFYFPDVSKGRRSTRIFLQLFRIGFVASAKVQYPDHVKKSSILDATAASEQMEKEPLFPLSMVIRSVADPLAYHRLAARSVWGTIALSLQFSRSKSVKEKYREGYRKAFEKDVDLLFEKKFLSNFERAKLWPEGQPDWFSKYWSDLQEDLRKLNPGWRFWTEWYDDKLNGRTIFGLSPDSAQSFEIEVANLSSKFWNQEANIVNSKLWYDAEKYRKRDRDNSIALKTNSLSENVEIGIIDFLSTYGGPASNNEINAHLVEVGIEIGRSNLNWRLSSLARDGTISRLQRGLYEIRSTATDIELGPIESQTHGALKFTARTDGRIEVSRRKSVGELSTDSGARKRHQELLRRVDYLLASYANDSQGGNASRGLVQEVELFSQTLGRAIEDVDPDLMIPRGDGLRSDLKGLRGRDDFSKLPPVPDDIIASLEKLVAAYNNYVSFDPELAIRDEALLGPDARKRMVSPKDGQILATDAVLKRAAMDEVVEVLAEEAKVAPEIPDAESRQSRRYSESAKNLFRKAIELAISFAQRAWSNKGKIIAIGTTGYAASQWVVANQQWLLGYFAENPTMTGILRKIIEILDKLPLA